MKIPAFRLERFFAKYEFNTRYLLCSSDCESLSIRDLLAYEPGAAERLQDQWLGYQSLFDVARSLGAQVSLWQTSDADGWELDTDWLAANIRPNTRAIIVNCPHNPTGYLMSAATQRRIVEIARQHDLFLFSDEVYRHLEHQPGTNLPAACDLYEKAVSLGVLSKTYGLAGLRIGWLATRHTALYQQIAALKDYTTICNSAPSEFLAGVALRHRDAIARRNLEIIHSNLAVLDTFFARHAGLFDWQPPQAGSTAFPRLKGDQSSDEFCARLVEQQGILLLPSSLFDYDDHHFRVGYGRRNLPEVIEHFETYLSEVEK